MINKFKSLPKVDLTDPVMESQLNKDKKLFLKICFKKKGNFYVHNFDDSANELTEVCKGIYAELNDELKFIYEGYFTKGEISGLGRMVFGSGNVYQGMF